MSGPGKSLSIVVPAFNEEESLKSYLPELLDFCRKHGFHLVVVNDGSSDGTGKLIDSLSGDPFFFPVHHKVNRNYGGAIKSGIEKVTTDYVITVDADGQHRLEDVLKMYETLLATNADMVVGKRTGKSTAYRSAGKWLIRQIAKILMKIPIHDLNSGIKLYDAGLAKKYIHLCPDSMAYSDIIALVFISQRHLVIETGVQVKERLAGKSTISARTAFQTVMEIINIVMLFNPSRVFLPLALISFLAGLGWGLPIMIRDKGVSVGALLAMLVGVLFFLLGLLAEQLSLIRKNQVRK